MMKPVIQQNSILVLGEVLSSAASMVKEIAHYKRAIVELELQREQMRDQAKLAHHQIQSQLKHELNRIGHLASNFEKVLEQNKILIEQHCQREKGTQQQCIQITTAITLAPDLETKQLLINIWQQLLKENHLNREESARLQAQLMDAHQQFGISISHRDMSFKDVY